MVVSELVVGEIREASMCFPRDTGESLAGMISIFSSGNGNRSPCPPKDTKRG